MPHSFVLRTSLGAAPTDSKAAGIGSTIGNGRRELCDEARGFVTRFGDGEFGPHGFAIQTREERLTFEGSSSSEFLDSELCNHPLWAASRETLERAGELETVRQRTLVILDQANEKPGEFQLSDRYVVATAQRP
jgi:hypothetical protein